MKIPTNYLTSFFLVPCFALLVQLPTANATPVWSFDVVPTGGNISGAASTTIGWGYSISNQDAVYSLSLTGVVADPFLYGTPDGSLFDYPVIAPNSTITVPYSASFGAGLYALSFDASAPAGSVDSGMFTLSADWIDAGGNFVQSAADQSAAYSATVTAVPVPAAVGLFGSGLLALLGGKRCKRSREEVN